MRYDVLKDYEDSERKVRLATGDVFTPAETHFPQSKVDALAMNGTLRLIEKAEPAEPKPPKSKKKDA